MINEMKTPHTAVVSDHSGHRPSILASNAGLRDSMVEILTGSRPAESL